MTGIGPIPLGVERQSGGLLQAVYSVAPGVRVRVFVLPEAYDATRLPQVRDHVARFLPAPPRHTTGTFEETP